MKALASTIRQGRSSVSENEPGNSGLIFSTVRSAGSSLGQIEVQWGLVHLKKFRLVNYGPLEGTVRDS